MKPDSAARVELGAGYSISRLLNGCWQLARGHALTEPVRSISDEQLLERVEAGFGTFDCADIYTGVEERLGGLLAEWRRRRGDPAAIQIHTKYVPDLADLAHIDRAAVERGIDRSLGRLGVERLDLVQFHWWDYAVPGYVEAGLWLDELRRAGKIRLVGATNFDCRRLTELLDAGVELATHQVQYSLLDRRPERDMARLCAERGVRLLAYGSLAGGLLGERFLRRPQAGAAPANRSQVKYGLVVEELGGWDALERVLAELSHVAMRHGAGVSEVAIRWVLDRPGVAGVILGMSPERPAAGHRRLFSLSLDEDDRRRLDGLLAAPPGDVYELERDPAGPHAAIMRTDLNRSG